MTSPETDRGTFLVRGDRPSCLSSSGSSDLKFWSCGLLRYIRHHGNLHEGVNIGVGNERETLAQSLWVIGPCTNSGIVVGRLCSTEIPAHTIRPEPGTTPPTLSALSARLVPGNPWSYRGTTAPYTCPGPTPRLPAPFKTRSLRPGSPNTLTEICKFLHAGDIRQLNSLHCQYWARGSEE